jgi:hypothetical protein
MISTTRRALTLGLLFSIGAIAQAQHFDIVLTTDGGKIRTNAENGSDLVPSYVFGADLGENPNLGPFTADEPGFEAEIGTFSTGTTIGWRFTRQIAKWNGTAFEDVANTITGEFVEGLNVLSATSGSGIAPGFELGLEDDGEFHSHVDWTLNGIGNTDPATGVYRLSIQFLSPANNVAQSDDVWIILNNGDTEENHDAAIEYSVQAVPEPATMTAMALGLAAIAARRKRK